MNVQGPRKSTYGGGSWRKIIASRSNSKQSSPHINAFAFRKVISLGQMNVQKFPDSPMPVSVRWPATENRKSRANLILLALIVLGRYTARVVLDVFGVI